MESVIRAWHDLPNTQLPSSSQSSKYEQHSPLIIQDNGRSSFASQPFNPHSRQLYPSSLSIDSDPISTQQQHHKPTDPFPGFSSSLHTWRSSDTPTNHPPPGFSNHESQQQRSELSEHLPIEYAMHDHVPYGYHPQNQLMDQSQRSLAQSSQHSLYNSSIRSSTGEASALPHPTLVRSRSTSFLSRPVQLGMHASANKSSLRLSMTMDDDAEYMAAADTADHQRPPPLHVQRDPAHYPGSYSAPLKSPALSNLVVYADQLGHLSSASIASSPEYMSKSRHSSQCVEPFPTMSASQSSVGSSCRTSFYGTPPHLSPPTPFAMHAPALMDDHSCYRAGPSSSTHQGGNHQSMRFMSEQSMWPIPNTGYPGPSSPSHYRIPHAYRSPTLFFNGVGSQGLGSVAPHHVDSFGLGSSGLRPRSFSATAALLTNMANKPDARNNSRASSPSMFMLPIASNSVTDLSHVYSNQVPVTSGPIAPILSMPSNTQQHMSDHGSVRESCLGLRRPSSSSKGSFHGTMQDLLAQPQNAFAMPPTLLPSLQALSGWAASRIQLYASKFGTPYPMYLSILGGEHVEFQFGFHVASNVGSVHGNKGLNSGHSSGYAPIGPFVNTSMQIPNTPPAVLTPGYFSHQHATTQGHSVAFVLVEQVSLATKATELHVPTCTNAPNHLLSWTTVYAANSFGIYRLTPLQSHVLPLFVRPLVQYSERIINKEKMPHLALAVGEGGTGKTWSYLLGCIDYIVRGSHFQRGGLVSSNHGNHHVPAYYNHPSQHGPMAPVSMHEQHAMLMNPSGPSQSNRVHHNQGPKAIILLPTKEAVMKMKKLLGDLAAAITNSWLKSQDMLGANHHQQRPQQLVSYLAIVGNIMKARLTMQLNDHDIIVATPSSLAELVENRNLRLDNVKYLIIDEITRVHEHASVQQLTSDMCTIVSHLPVSTKSHSIKVVLFSRHWNTNVQYLTERIAASFQVAPPSSPQHLPGTIFTSSNQAAPSNSTNMAPNNNSSTESVPIKHESSVSGQPTPLDVSAAAFNAGATYISQSPMPCESYLKIVVCPKAFPHTIFPRPCLVPFAHHTLRPLAHIPHHFVPVASNSMRFDALIQIMNGNYSCKHPVTNNGLSQEDVLSPSAPLSGDSQHISDHPLPVDSNLADLNYPWAIILMTNTLDEASDLHKQLNQWSATTASFLVMPETLESTLNAVRAMALQPRVNDIHLRNKSDSISNVSITAPPSPGFMPINQEHTIPSESVKKEEVPILSDSDNKHLDPLQKAERNEPMLALVTVRPDAQSASWMLDLKVIAPDLPYTIVNYVCPATIDDYVLSLLTHVSPHVSFGVDGALKMTMSPNRVPPRSLPEALVTLYSTDSNTPVSFGSSTSVPNMEMRVEASQDVISGPMHVGEYMPTTECDCVNLFRAVANAISQRQCSA